MTDMEYILKAITNLRTGAGFSLQNDTYAGLVWQDTTFTKPTLEEVTLEISRLKDDYITKEYQRIRAIQYPSFVEQLDMLYHDIKDGKLDSGAWIQTIEDVKARYPKN